MKTFVVFAAAMLFAAVVTAEEGQVPSSEMREIIQERFHGEGLDSTGLKKLRYEDLEQIDKLTRFEKYMVPHPIGADIVEHEVWRSLQTGAYLIVETGGEGGLLNVYGVAMPKQRPTRVERNGTVKRSQPIGSETNSTSSSASPRN